MLRILAQSSPRISSFKAQGLLYTVTFQRVLSFSTSFDLIKFIELSGSHVCRKLYRMRQRIALCVVALAVSQVCSEDGMEFTLRTPEGFIGRIYTYGYYDRCFFRGNGGTVNVLRISGPQGYPECGTQRVRAAISA